jgi:hypothetical protein
MGNLVDVCIVGYSGYDSCLVFESVGDDMREFEQISIIAVLMILLVMVFILVNFDSRIERLEQQHPTVTLTEEVIHDLAGNH